MRRGTTPTHEFVVDVDMTSATAIYITYKQRDKVILEKNIDDITVTDTKLMVTLTQEETLMFNINNIVEIQIRAKMDTGGAIASNIIKTSAQRILKEGVI